MANYISEEGHIYTIDEINQTATETNSSFDDVVKRNNLFQEGSNSIPENAGPGKKKPAANATVAGKSTASKSAQSSWGSQSFDINDPTGAKKTFKTGIKDNKKQVVKGPVNPFGKTTIFDPLNITKNALDAARVPKKATNNIGPGTKLDSRGYPVAKNVKEPTLWDNAVDFAKNLFIDKNPDENGKLSYYDQTPIKEQQLSFKKNSQEALTATGKFEFLKDYSLEDRALFVSKLVPKTSYTEKVYNQETDDYDIVPKKEALDYITKDIDPKKFKTKAQLDNAIALNVKKLASEDSSFEFEQKLAKIKAAPLINKKIEEIKKKYSLTDAASVEKATKELQSYAATTITDLLVNSSGFQHLNQNFSDLESQATATLTKQFERGKEFGLNLVDTTKQIGKSVSKVPGLGVAGKIIEGGAELSEMFAKGATRIANSVNQSLVSTNHGQIKQLSDIYKSIEGKSDSQKIDKNFESTWINGELSTFDPSNQNPPATYGEAKSRLKSYLDKTNSLIGERVQKIADTKEYLGLFNEADLKDGIGLRDVVRLVGEQTPNLLVTTAGTVSGNPLLIGLGTASMFSQTYGNQYYDTIETGLKEKLGRNPNKEEIAEAIGSGKYADRAEAAASAAVSSGLEFASELNIIKNTGKALGFGNDAKTVLGSLFRGEMKNFGKSMLNQAGNISKSGIGEYLTESLQTAIDQTSKGLQLHNDASKYIDLKEINESGKVGSLVGAVFPFVGTIKTQTAIELRAAATQVASAFDLSGKNMSNLVQVDNFFKAASNNIEERFKVGDINSEQKRAELETLGTIRSSGAKIPSEFNPKAKEKALGLMLEKANIERSIEGKDKDLVTPELERLKVISADLTAIAFSEKERIRTKDLITDIEQTKVAIKELNAEDKYDVPDLNTANDVRAYLEKNTNLTPDEIDYYEDSNGAFVPLKNGKHALIINKEEAEMAGISTTGLHETGHALLYKAISNNKFLAKKIGTDLYNYIEQYIGTDILNNTEFKSRYDQYKADFEEQKKHIEDRVSYADDLFNKGQIDEDVYTELKQKADNIILKAESKYLEETIPLLSESLKKGDIKYNETFFTKLGDIIRRVFQKFGLKNISFKTGKDVFDFVRDYNKSFESGKFNKAFKNLESKGTYTGEKSPINLGEEKTVKQSKPLSQVETLKNQLSELEDNESDYEPEDFDQQVANLQEKIKRATEKEKNEPKAEVKKEKPTSEENDVKEIIRENKASVASDKVQKIYDAKGKEGAQDIINLFKPITKKIVDKRRDAPGFDRELLTDEIETGVGGILDLITKYNPESGIPLAAYINKYLPVRAIATSKRILDAEFSKDVTEEKGLMAEETVSETKEKPKYANALESKVFEPEVLETINNKILSIVRTLKSRIDTPVTLNKTVTPLIGEIRDNVGKQIDIDVKTVMGGKKDNQLKNWLLKNKKYILENMTTTWLMGKDGQGGIPYAIQKQIDGKWVNYPDWVGKKIDREKTTTDQAGRTSGHEIVRRLPNAANNVSNEEFLNNVLEPSGNPIRGRKESLAKAIAEEASFDIILGDFANEGIIFDAFKTNQERLGVELLETISVELSRQAERGNVKQSKKIIREALNTLSKNDWDLNNEDYKNFISNLPEKDGNYINNLLQNKSIKQLRLHLNAVDLEDKEFDFKDKIISSLKDPINNVRSKINRFELISKEASTSTSKLNDLKIKYKNNIYNFELKLTNDSRLKGTVINNVTTSPSINQDTGINDVIYKAINESAGIKAYTDHLLANGGTINANGSIKVPISVFSDQKSKSLQDKAKVTISTDANFLKKLNNNVNDAITFGGAGTFTYDDSKFDGILPVLKGDVDFTITTQRGSMDADKNVSVYFIGFPKMANNWEQKSTIDIHKNPKKLLTIIRKASLLRRNRESARAINIVLNASKPTYTLSPKKINVIDIDEKLNKIKSKISYKNKEGKIKKISIPEFLKEQMLLELDGIIFDYSDVNEEIKNNKEILNGFDKDNLENNFAVTSNPVEYNSSIQTLLKNIGINIPSENIATLEENTDEAKVNLITSKLNDGFNDFTIVGKNLEDSKGIKEILDDFDIKGTKQKEKVDFLNSLDKEFNRIIASNTGIGSAIKYSDIVARRRGAGKNRFDIYVPASAADFELLLYNFMGKGTKGEEQKKFFTDALLKPYSNGNDLMDAARQSIKREYKQLLTEFPDVAKKIEKITPDGDFTYDQAIRVAMWNDEGVEIPGLSQRDTNKLTELVNNDPELKAFKEGLIVTGRQGRGWVKPEEYWDANTIITDLHNLTEGEGRKKFLSEFIANAEEIFGKWENGKLVGSNINKVEAVYGTDVRKALEDVLYRMITGKNRGYGNDKDTSNWAKWVTGSTGAIMFLNIRSAALQLIGAVNFLNLRDNNPYAAAKAFANQKQYWEDFARIWNSDKMKERRGGLKEDVAAAEIANAAAGSKNKVGAVLSYLLKIGYTPTQMADSFAIASGGAPFYRNRIKSYLEEGMTEREAEDAAWDDFTKVSDETQQSGDPRDISKQQASAAGRLLLTFQNTAMQQSRIVKKAFLDLKNGRGDAKTNFAKIAYYIAIQNTMFAVLQQGLFAVAFGDDDEDKEKPEKEKKLNEKLFDVADGVVDTILRGTGFAGGIVATVKNMAKKYLDERDKKFKADYAKVVLEGANLSPPIGSKLRKLYSGLQQTKFDKDLIEKRGWDVMQDGRVKLSPSYSVTGKVVEAFTNVPMDRLVTKVNNASEALNSQNTAMQRIMVGLGWSPYSAGIEESAGDKKIREEAKKFRKEEGKIKAAETRERKRDSIRSLPFGERLRLKREAKLKRRHSRRKMG